MTRRERETGRDDARCPGLRVTVADGSVYFFPAGTVELGMAWARPTVGDELNAPTTRIEYGTRLNDAWTCEKVVQAPPERPERRDRP